MEIKVSSSSSYSPPAHSRTDFLHTLGFPIDPFRFQVVEQAWAFAPNREVRTALLNAYRPFAEEERWLDMLMTHRDINPRYVITGTAGSGKTALAWHWMEKVTLLRPDALVVLFDAAEVANSTPLSFGYYWANAVVKALLLYLLDPHHADAPLWIEDVLTLRQGGGASVKRLLDKLVTSEDTAALLWNTLCRPYWYGQADPSGKLLQLLALAHDPLFMKAASSDFNPTTFLFSLKGLFSRLGIQQVYLFVDNVTDTIIEQPHTRWCVQQVLQQSALGDVPLVTTLFADVQIAEFLTKSTSARGREVVNEHYHLEWTKERLQQVLVRRWTLRTGCHAREARLRSALLAGIFQHSAFTTPRACLAHVSELINQMVGEVSVSGAC